MPKRRRKYSPEFKAQVDRGDSAPTVPLAGG